MSIREWKRGTAAQRAANAQVSPGGEFGIETDTGNMVVPDGITAWKDLSPLLTEAVASSTYVPVTNGAATGLRVNGNLIGTNHLPVLAIDTASAAPIVSEDVYLTCSATVTNPETGVTYYTGAQIKGHGNSTWGQPKNPYKLKLASKASVRGMASAKNWIMLANYFDETAGLNNALALTLGSWMSGLDWTPHFRFANVIINGVFVGLYQITEDIELNSARVNFSDPTSDTGLGLTGTYLLEVDARYPGDGSIGFVTPQGVIMTFNDPDAPTAAQTTYLTNWILNFESVLFGGSFLDPVTGYAPMIDMDSWADWYIVEELTSNQDSLFYASCYMYKTPDTSTVPGILFMGPIWDFDLAFDNPHANQSPPHLPNLYYTRDGPWFTQMFRDPVFVEHVAARWNILYDAHLANAGIFQSLDDFLVQLNDSELRDQQKWAYVAYLAQSSYTRKVWLDARITWLNGVLDVAGDPITTTVLENV